MFNNRSKLNPYFHSAMWFGSRPVKYFGKYSPIIGQCLTIGSAITQSLDKDDVFLHLFPSEIKHLRGCSESTRCCNNQFLRSCKLGHID